MKVILFLFCKNDSLFKQYKQDSLWENKKQKEKDNYTIGM